MTLGTQLGDKSLLKFGWPLYLSWVRLHSWHCGSLQLGPAPAPFALELILGPSIHRLSPAWVGSQPLSGEVSWGLVEVRRPDLALASEVKLESLFSVQLLPPLLEKSPSELTGRM